MANNKVTKESNNDEACKTDNIKRGKQNGKRNNRRSNAGRQNGSGARSYTDPGSNDPKWYGTDPSLLRDSASIPFSWAVGTPVRTNNPVLKGLPDQGDFAIPGICSLYLMPTVGQAANPSAPINIAATATYSFVRHANSGHSNYDAPDLMIYLLSMTQVYAYINFLQRAYGVATLYSQRNRYMPAALLESMNIDPSDIQAHLADFRYGINVLINKAASLAIPNNMPIFNRQAFLYQNIYTEGSSVKDQMYLYNPLGFWKYTLKPDDLSGRCSYVAYRTSDDKRYSCNELIEFGNQLLYPILSSEDMNIMSGDILKAYGQNIIKLQSLGLDYPMVPVYNLAVLEQIKNATIAGNVQSVEVEQDSTHGYLISNPMVRRSDKAGQSTVFNKGYTRSIRTLEENKILTTLSADTNPELVIESTRLMLGARNYQEVTSSTTKVDLLTGSEIAASMALFYYANVSGEWTLKQLSYEYAAWLDTTGNETYLLNEFRKMATLAHFRYHPAIHVLAVRAGSTEGAIQFGDSEMVLDVDNYAVLSNEDLEHMHEAALLNQLHVPSIGKL